MIVYMIIVRHITSNNNTNSTSSCNTNVGRGDDAVGNPPRAQISRFKLFELILLLKLDNRFPVERFEAAVSQSTVPSHPHETKSKELQIIMIITTTTHTHTYIQPNTKGQGGHPAGPAAPHLCGQAARGAASGQSSGGTTCLTLPV